MLVCVCFVSLVFTPFPSPFILIWNLFPGISQKLFPNERAWTLIWYKHVKSGIWSDSHLWAYIQTYIHSRSYQYTIQYYPEQQHENKLHNLLNTDNSVNKAFADHHGLCTMTTTAEQAVVVCIHTNTTIATPQSFFTLHWLLVTTFLFVSSDVSLAIKRGAPGPLTESPVRRYGGLEVGAVTRQVTSLLTTDHAYFVITWDVRVLGPVPGFRRPRPSAAPQSQVLCYGVGCAIWGPHPVPHGRWVVAWRHQE